MTETRNRRQQSQKRPENMPNGATRSKEFNTDKTADQAYSLVTWNDLENWRHDNQYILSSYRETSYSYLKSISSITKWHNESINIWSHMIPALLSLPCAWFLSYTLGSRYERATKRDVVAFGCFFMGATLCLGMSSTYHTIQNHSPRVNKIGNKLDYVGIVLLITGSFIPAVHYGFWCDRTLQIIYWTMICSLGAICTTVSIMEKFRTPLWRPFRASMFVALGLSAVVPVLHGVQIYGMQKMMAQMGLFWLVLQGVLYIVGAGLYAARIPEKWYPGRYDIIGSSHQIFHILVVLAAISHLVGLLKAFDYRHGIPGAFCK